MPGYSDEPYLRIGPDSVQRNVNSPATYLNATPEGDSALPLRADPSDDQDWERVSAEPSLTCHDHRTHWMGSTLLLLLLLLALRSIRAVTTSAPYAVGLIGFVLLMQGLSDVSVFWHSQVPSAGPAWLARAAVVVTFGLGAGVTLGSLRVLRGAGALTGGSVSPASTAAG
ncbi:MAG: hypothetical protein H0T85_03335 [Geodermatophilaceae bacterium]|nr:hypothetical protein [Geodermatophilaceae bacterium]